MNDEQKHLDDAINQANKDWETYAKAQRIFEDAGNQVVNWMRGYDLLLDDLVRNPPFSRRERRRMEKAERQKALKARKQK